MFRIEEKVHRGQEIYVCRTYICREYVCLLMYVGQDRKAFFRSFEYFAEFSVCLDITRIP